MFMESRIRRFLETRSIHDYMKIPKIEFIS